MCGHGESSLTEDLSSLDQSKYKDELAPVSSSSVEQTVEKAEDETDGAAGIVVTTQGIFAHSTSLEDSITDDMRNLDLLKPSSISDSDSILAGASMKSSIHELQGDDLALKGVEEDIIESQQEVTNPTERFVLI